jgi:hypothetical protein
VFKQRIGCVRQLLQYGGSINPNDADVVSTVPYRTVPYRTIVVDPILFLPTAAVQALYSCFLENFKFVSFVLWDFLL